MRGFALAPDVRRWTVAPEPPVGVAARPPVQARIAGAIIQHLASVSSVQVIARASVRSAWKVLFDVVS